MNVPDNIIALLVIVAPPIACVLVGQLTGLAVFFFLAFPACLVGPWLGSRLASKSGTKPRKPPSKG